MKVILGTALVTWALLSLIWPHEGRRTIVVVPMSSCPADQDLVEPETPKLRT